MLPSQPITLRRGTHREQALEQRIRQRAYEIWDAVGRPQGASELHWLAAEREVLAASVGPMAQAQQKSLRANRLVARNPLRLELARQRDISYGRSAVSKGSMKPGGPTGGTPQHGFTTPTNVRGRPVAWAAVAFATRTIAHRARDPIGEVRVGSTANRQWNRSAASRIRECPANPIPPSPPCLAGLKLGRSPSPVCARFLLRAALAGGVQSR
jgi:hypothetical protein